MSTADLMPILPNSPLRPPNWRWCLAQHSRQHPEELWVTRHMDASVRTAIAAMENTGVVHDGAEADFSPWDVTTALGIWAANDWDRCIVECRILAGQPLCQIAEQTTLSVPVATAFHDLFFDVMTRRRYRGYVNRFAVRVPASYSAAIDLQTALRAFAFVGGPLVLDVLLAAHTKEIRTSVVCDSALQLEIDRQLVLQARDALRIFRTPVTPANQLSWIEIYCDIYAAQKLAGRAPRWRATARRIRDTECWEDNHSVPEVEAEITSLPQERSPEVEVQTARCETSTSPVTAAAETPDALECWHKVRQHTVQELALVCQKAG